MKPGRPTPNPARKKLSGTYRDDRHGNIVALVQPAKSVPIRPDYMTAEGRAIWDEEFPRVVACGALESDSSIFARYCEMEALFRVSIMAAEFPKAALITELRRTAELLGIGGLRSRLAKTGGDAPKANPFSVRQ